MLQWEGIFKHNTKHKNCKIQLQDYKKNFETNNKGKKFATNITKE